MNNEDLWKAVLGEMELSLTKPQFITWFKNTFIVSNENNRIVIGVPNNFSKEWLENKFNNKILKALRNHQFKEDASPMAHSIRPSSFEEISNFYTSTVYSK